MLLAIKIELPNVDKTMQVSEIDRAHFLTNQSGLYVFYDTDGNALYAGKSINLYSRLRDHRKSADFFGRASRIDLYFVEDSAERDIYETYIISTLRPQYNREKVYTKQREKSDELLELDGEIEYMQSELEEIKQELKFTDWCGDKYDEYSIEYHELQSRAKTITADIDVLKRKKSQIIRKYFK